VPASDGNQVHVPKQHQTMLNSCWNSLAGLALPCNLKQDTLIREMIDDPPQTENEESPNNKGRIKQRLP